MNKKSILAVVSVVLAVGLQVRSNDVHALKEHENTANSANISNAASLASEDRETEAGADSDSFEEREALEAKIIRNLDSTLAEVDEFLEKLKKAIRNNNPKEMSELISYPCTFLGADKKQILINDKEEFKKLYSHIVTTKLKNIVLETDVKKLIIGDHGCGIGDGAIWFNPRKGGVLAFGHK